MTENESNYLQNLTAALMQSAGDSSTGETPITRPTPAERCRANLRRIHAAEEGLRCPSCGFEGPESEFDTVELDEDSDSDGYRTADEAGETGSDDDQAEAKLAQALLKSANASQAKQSNGLKQGPKLTAEEATKLIQAAIKNLRK